MTCVNSVVCMYRTRKQGWHAHEFAQNLRSRLRTLPRMLPPPICLRTYRARTHPERHSKRCETQPETNKKQRGKRKPRDVHADNSIQTPKRERARRRKEKEREKEREQEREKERAHQYRCICLRYAAQEVLRVAFMPRQIQNVEHALICPKRPTRQVDG